MDLKLKGKRVAITGASKGIGAAIAESMAKEGCALHLVARNRDGLAGVRDRLASTYGVEVHIHAADLREGADLSRIANELPQLDILVNNAGDIPGGTINKVDEAAWRRGWELKVYGFINLTRTIYARMVANGGGVILNVIGVAGERFDYDYIAGSAGNAALMAFTRALGSRSLDHNIRVVGVSPGPVETDRIITLMKTKAKAKFGDEGRYKEMMSAWPLGRAAKPEEVADMFAFLASERSAYTSGAIITIDGGLSSRGGF